MENQIPKKKFELSVLGALGIVLLYLLILVDVIDIPFTFASETMYCKNHEAFQAVIIAVGAVISRIIVVKLILKQIRSDHEINFNIKYIEKFNFKLLVCTLFFMFGFFLWYHSSIGIVVDKIPMPQSIEKGFERLSINPYSMIISTTIIAPIFEEIIMRGIILDGFLNKYKPINAIIASALIFGLVHLNIPQFINAVIIGLIFGLIYYKTRCLILCIAAHALNNTTAITLGYMNFQFNIISFFIGTVIFIIAGIFLVRYIKRVTDDKVNYQVDNTSI
jgi:membrane protease YdiL (CAAX protease family)